MSGEIVFSFFWILIWVLWIQKTAGRTILNLRDKAVNNHRNCNNNKYAPKIEVPNAANNKCSQNGPAPNNRRKPPELTDLYHFCFVAKNISVLPPALEKQVSHSRNLPAGSQAPANQKFGEKVFHDGIIANRIMKGWRKLTASYNEGLPYSEQINFALLRRVCQKLSFKSPYENASI